MASLTPTQAELDAIRRQREENREEMRRVAQVRREAETTNLPALRKRELEQANAAAYGR